MTNEKKISIIEEALDVDSGSLAAETVLAEVEEWDSMTKLSVIVMFDDECGKKLTGEMIRAFVTVGDIMNAMD